MHGGGDGLSRRRLLSGSAAAIGAAGLSPWIGEAAAQVCSPNAISRTRRPVPNLTYRTANIIDTIAQVRPNRIGGVRVEKMPARGSGAARRWIVHNYGHGGGGITLSFGCASVVSDFVQEIIGDLGGNAAPSVAVVGSGVIGLTTAHAIKTRFRNLAVTIYSKDVELSKTCSWVAAGQFEPSGIWRAHTSPEQKANLRKYLQRSAEHIRQLKSRGVAAQYGIADRSNFSLSAGIAGMESEFMRPVIGPPRCGQLPFERLSVQGREYRTWLVNPRVLMPKLVRDLNDMGVLRRQRTLVAPPGSMEESGFLRVLTEQIIVNCTGFGSEALVRNSGLQPIKGQIVVLRNPDTARYNYFFSGSQCETERPNYLFCRQHDIVVGGLWDIGNRTLNADDNTAEAIMGRLRRLFNGNTSGC